ncbi:hemolysin family protein [Limimaricola sp. G21655-S1]|uniref:transporter associated domain-containing protein n=1 Tax=unclassified Limimaricola TaxID=2626459 RepID=UPI0022AEF3AC|nr:hemolysin family protein [Limimaricola sp. G21655-S1]MCZ4261878.1 hemolysin family protein [Limimaricola sp. G21655-S1]
MGDAFDTAEAGQTRDGDGDGPEGPSSVTAENGGGRGFFSRIIGVLNPPETDLPPIEAPRSFAQVLPVPGMLNLRRMRVEDVMVPKADITAVPVTIPMEELVEVFRESGLTRIPVFDGTLDTPIGLVNLKDFALKFCFVPERPDFSLRDMLRSLLYVPPSMPLGVLLQKMQTERIHMALVIDEYGGTDGLVTIEDLIETVVGEIEDEHDVDEAQSFLREKPGVWLALARTPLETFERAIGMDLTDHEEIDEEEIDSLGGLVSMLAGHVPARGEVIEHPAGIEFEVIDADPRRIKRLRIRLPESRDA